MQRVVFRARGHDRVRARHEKTIELTTAADLTERGTCVVGVGADLDADALGGLAGRATVTLTTDAGHRDVIAGTANPGFRATDRLVIRRSSHRSADTLVFAADKGAADLDRGLVDALADPGTVLTVTLVVEEDDAAPVTVAAADLPGAAAVDLPVGAEVAARPRASAPGTPAAIAAALVAAPAGAVLFGDGPPTVVREVRPSALGAELDALAGREVAVVLDPGTPDERILHDRPAGRVRAKRVVLVAAPADGAGDELDGLLAALLRRGVPLRTLQAALVDATGAPKREVYEHLLRLKGS